MSEKESEFTPDDPKDEIPQEIHDDEGARSEKDKQEDKIYLEALERYLTKGGDPIEFAQKFSEMHKGQPQPERYEDMAEVVWDKCLEKISLLEDYQLAIRGDCLDSAMLETYKRRKVGVFSAVRNARRRLLKSQKSIVLGRLLGELARRIDLAYYYELKKDEEIFEEPVGRELQKEKEYDVSPAIIYGSRKFNPKTEKLEKLEDDSIEDYFFGHTDDIGATVVNTNFIVLPQTIKWRNKEESVQKEELFPTILLTASLADRKAKYNIDRKLQKRISRRIKQCPHELSAIERLSHPKSYFNILLITHKILADIEY